jgi:cytochrome c oxidase subunit 2
LAPHSPATDQIDTLLWIGFIAAAIAVIVINLALFYAVRKYRGERGSEPRQVSGGRGIQFRVGAVLTAFAALVFVVSVIFTDKARETPSTGSEGLTSAAKKGPLEIKATGQQWLWRYDYPNGAFSYYKLVVPADTAIALDLVTTDVIHTWNVPDLAGKRDAVPGKTTKILFSSQDEGSYTGRSATLSGQAYAAMGTEVEVVSADEYEDYIKQLKADIEAAQERVVGQIESGDVP